MDELIRILLVDDHPVVRQGLSAMLVPRNGMQVIGEAGNGHEAIILAAELRPDVIIMDLVMPGTGGAEATARIMEEDPSARILILTSFGEQAGLIEALQAGAAGCLVKDSTPDDLLHAIHSVHRGQIVIPQDLVNKILNRQPVVGAQTSILTDREREVALLVAQGLSNKAIADKLVVSSNTVRSHVSSILAKLALDNRTQIAVRLRDEKDPSSLAPPET